MLLYEDVITKMVLPNQIGIGERVSVVTKMGESVSEGEVLSSTAGLVTLREGDGRVATYQAKFYSFIPAEIDEAGPPDPANPQRGMIGGTDHVVPDQSQADAEKENQRAIDSTRKEAKDRKKVTLTKKTEKEKEKESKEKDSADSEAAVDVDKLPDDIRQHMDRADKLDPVLVDQIVGSVGDTIVADLRTEKIQQEMVYQTVLEVQRAVREVLTKTKIPIVVTVKK